MRALVSPVLLLGIDYNIFLMHRVREEAVRLGHRRGVLEGLTSTGGVITAARLFRSLGRHQEVTSEDRPREPSPVPLR